MTELSYSEKNKLAWKNISKKWDNMTDEEKCGLIMRVYNTPTSFIPKELIHKVYRWVIDGVLWDRLEFANLADEKREKFKLVLPISSVSMEE